ncbi:MerR family transcriptional regulator [bacterium]|nr:MerR family transcriptional regulator [bacterium]
MPKKVQPDILYSISQVNALTGVPKSTIRFWEKEFIDFLIPLRTTGNQRRYDREKVDVIENINRLVNQDGYTLEGARRQLANENGNKTESEIDPEMNLSELAETMSDFLLQKMFEQARFEKHSAKTSLEKLDSNSKGELL